MSWPNTMCLDRLGVPKKSFQSIKESDYQCPQCLSTCQVRNSPFEEQTASFSLKFGQRVYLFEERKKSIRGVIEDMFCPICPNENCVLHSANTLSSFYDCRKCKTCSHVQNIPFKNHKLTIMLFGGDGTRCFARKTSRYYEERKTIPIFEKIPPPITISTLEPQPEKVKIIPLMV